MIEISLNENISIENIRELYWEITRAMDNGESVIIDFSSVRSADISLRLIIESVIRRAKKTNVKIELINIPDSLKYLFTKSFFSLERRYGKNPDCGR